jgi:membrane fusion protein, multidrug efflux system
MKERRIADRRQQERRESERKKKRFDFKIIILVAIVGLFIFVWYQRNIEEKEAEEEIKAPVQVIAPQSGTLTQVITINGYVESETTVTVLPKISGTLTELFVDIGDRVSKDQILGKIDSESYKLNLRQAEATYLAAKSTFERTKQLYEANATSKQNYDQAKSHYDAAESQYELAKLTYTYTDIEAPITGSVLKKHATAGSLVSGQVPIVTIGDLEELIIKAKIPEKYYARFSEVRSGNSPGNLPDNGITTAARVPALDNREFVARIRTVAPFISPETKNFEIICELTGNTASVRPGMFLYVTFVLEKKENLYYLPFTALTGGTHLWYVEEEQDTDVLTAYKMEYTPGFSNEDYFEIPKKYSGYRFIVEGQHFLNEGQQVKILEDS